jgi:aspartate/methionine/tyrosine aminotransferase
MVGTGGLSGVLRRHAELERLHGDGDGGDFISGWQVENPWARSLKNKVAAEMRRLPAERYVYLDQDEGLASGLRQFHRAADGVEPEALFVGAGASSLLVTAAAYLSRMGVSEVFYLPPLYFSMHAALKIFGIRARPIRARHAFEKARPPRWPTSKAVLLLCDPLWYAGVPVAQETMSELATWQEATGSLILVDGSFQYMRWDGALDEPSARLAGPTIRILCPTKALGLHGFRCAYALMPAALHGAFGELYGYLYASASLGDLALARVAIGELDRRTVMRGLMKIAAARHRSLRDAGVISAEWDPEAGYFTFEKVNAPGPLPLLMDGTYFEQRRFPGYYRINLLSPQLHRLHEQSH